MSVPALSQSGKPLLIYLGDLTYTTPSLTTDAFPLNVGFIAAYAWKIYGNDQLGVPASEPMARRWATQET